jgi:acyl-CoA thioester hydrolase
MSKEFKYVTKIYYEDTDAGGVVYYANYLKFLERARSEAIYSLGLSNKEILEKEGVIIIVKTCNIEYKKPAKFEDEIEIISNIKEVKNSSFKMRQVIKKKFDIISEADVVLVTVNKEGKPVRIPSILKKLID